MLGDLLLHHGDQERFVQVIIGLSTAVYISLQAKLDIKRFDDRLACIVRNDCWLFCVD